jgi:hypothetical protein
MSRHNAEMVDTEAGQCLLHVGRRRTGTIIFGLCEIRLRILVTIRCKKFLLANTRLEIRRQQVFSVPVNYAMRFSGPVTTLTARRVRYGV